MGPKSKRAVCDCLGNLIEEAQAQRVLLAVIKAALGRIEHALQAQLTGENADLVQVNRRLTDIERSLRHAGIPSPQ